MIFTGRTDHFRTDAPGKRYLVLVGVVMRTKRKIHIDTSIGTYVIFETALSVMRDPSLPQTQLVLRISVRSGGADKDRGCVVVYVVPEIEGRRMEGVVPGHFPWQETIHEDFFWPYGIPPHKALGRGRECALLCLIVDTSRAKDVIVAAYKEWPDWGLNPGLLDIYQVLYH